MKEKMTNQQMLTLSVVCLIGFCAVAVLFNVFSVGELPANFVGAALGAVITGVVTVFLLKGQSQAEEEKERNIQIFEKRSELFFNYIDKLWKAAEDQRLTAEEYEDLRKTYSVRLMIYLKKEGNKDPSKDIADHLLELGKCVDSSENKYDEIKAHVFAIINVLSGELDLGGQIDPDLDKKLEEPIFPLLFKQAVQNEMNWKLKSAELNEGVYRKGEELVKDGGWSGEYLCFDFKRFKDCKLVIGPFSKANSDQAEYVEAQAEQAEAQPEQPENSPEQPEEKPIRGGLWMRIFVEPDIREINDYRSEGNKALIEIRGKNKEWAELTGLQPNARKTYINSQIFNFSPPPKNWNGLFFDNPQSLKDFFGGQEEALQKYQAAASELGKRAEHWFKNGRIKKSSITSFLKTYLGDSRLLKQRLEQELNWNDQPGHKRVTGVFIKDLFIGYDRVDNWIIFVFYKAKMKNDTWDIVKEILNDKDFKGANFKETVEVRKEWWFGKSLITENFSNSDEKIQFIVDTCKKLQKKTEEALEKYLEGIQQKEDNPEYALGKECWNPIRAKLKEEFGYRSGTKRLSFYKSVKVLDIYIHIGANTDEYIYWLGFWSGKDFSANTALPKILNECLPETYFGETDDLGDPGHWLVKPFRITAYAKASQEDIAEYLAGRLHQLKEKAAQALEE